MGKFAEAAAQYDVEQRGDGKCVAGRWISENLDEEDLVEFDRLAKGHKWTRIISLSEYVLKIISLDKHVHGTCICIPEVAARGCCSCIRSKDDS